MVGAAQLAKGRFQFVIHSLFVEPYCGGPSIVIGPSDSGTE